MNRLERGKTVLAMEQLVRCINHEGIFESWLIGGVADGDIDDNTTPDDPILDYYCEDNNFRDLMGLFLRLMARAKDNGGLYCDKIVTKEG